MLNWVKAQLVEQAVQMINSGCWSVLGQDHEPSIGPNWAGSALHGSSLPLVSECLRKRMNGRLYKAFWGTVAIRVQTVDNLIKVASMSASVGVDTLKTVLARGWTGCISSDWLSTNSSNRINHTINHSSISFGAQCPCKAVVAPVDSGPHGHSQ